MRSLIAGEMVPMAIKKMRKNLRLDFVRSESRIAVAIAFVPRREISFGDRGTIRIDGRREDDGL